MTFDPTKPVQTRDGRRARIICTNMNSSTPIVAAITMNTGTFAGKEYVTSFFPNGCWSAGVCASDLVNTPQRHKHADVIIAWANGAKIQVFRPTREGYENSIRDKWVDETGAILWCEEYQYRVKPE